MQTLGAAFAALGVGSGDVVAQFSDNSSRWLIADQAIMMNGAINAVRGAQADVGELMDILEHSGAVGLVLQDAKLLDRLLPKLQPEIAKLRFVVLLWGEPKPEAAMAAGTKVYTFDEFRSLGGSQLAQGRRDVGATSAAVHRDMVASLVYTSGTTSAPKAAALTHGNILYQVENLSYFIQVNRGDVSLSLLPPWHIYERSTSYFVLSSGARQVYSSVAQFKGDLTKFRPDYLLCVPLLLDTLHSRIMGKLAKLPEPKKSLAMGLMRASRAHVQARRLINGVSLDYAFKRPSAITYVAALLTFLATFIPHVLAGLIVYKKIRQELGIKQTVISGGGSLASHLDDFFECLGLPVCNGWGLTETSPVLACRRRDAPGDPARNVRGTVGHLMPGTSLRIVEPECPKREVRPGDKGLILARGPGVFKGYWNNPDATAAAFVDGYYDTGDLGRVVPPGNLMSGQLLLTGRAKDTIVLAGGENVSPQPIEDALCCSGFIKHAMLVGQDKRTLGCLVCLDEDGFAAFLQERGDTRERGELSTAELNNVLLVEVKRLNQERPGRKVWEVISEVQVVREPFSVEAGTLTQTMKLRRAAVEAKYQKDVDAVMARLR